MRLEDIRKLCDEVYHGPCFPLQYTTRFDTWRIEDVHGNVVIEAPDGAGMIDLPEAREAMILAVNVLPKLLAVAEAASLMRYARKKCSEPLYDHALNVELENALAVLEAET